MPAIACCVDSTYTFSTWDTSLPTPPTAVTWSPSHSESLYRVNGWGAPYFSVNDNGNISVHPYGDNTLPHQEMDLLKVVKKATDPKSSGGLGLHLPLIVRFPDVLQNRLQNLQSSFDFAIHSTGYAAHYQGVYPVKCNQDKFVVEDIVRFGSGFRFGLEAGSKPELLLAMSCLCNGSAEGLLVCNGFKDAEYISLALVARKMHLNTVIVLEQEEELDIVIDVSKRLGVRPVIGLRAKLRTKHSGHFGSTSGEKGKFGLTTMQILNVVTKLREHEMLDCLQLLHFHIGSQIPTTLLLADGVSEAAQIYCELVRLGAGMKVIDIGGGLGIDYDGSKSQDSDISVAYTLQEYASAVVQTIRLVCDRKGVNHPVLCSESGRAIVSHHSILVFEAVSASSPNNSLQEITPLGIQYIVDRLTGDAFSEYGNLSAAAMRGEYDTCLLYTEQLKQKCAEQFKDGTIGLEQLAAVDGLCELVTKAMGGGSDPTRTYDVNLSVFTSIPDFWGIGQLFPIMPIHRLEEKPTTRAILSDLTCDSDGKIDKFIGGDSSLPLHELDSYGGPYYLGMFLGGAYQESLGGLHNLFGGPSVVRVSQSDGPHGFAVTSAVPGPSCGDVLRVMQFEPELMYQTLKHRIEEVEGDESGGNNNSFIDGIACTFNSMPYLSPASSCSSLIAEAAGDTNNGYYYCSDVADSVASEEDQWSYCVT